MAERADVLIIGAGVAGLGAAFMLAPDAKVIVLEAESAPCTQTSGRSAAMFLTTYGPEAVRAATIASEPFYENPPAGFTETSLLSHRGVLFIDAQGGAKAREMIAANPTIVEISPEEAQKMAPILKLESVDAVAYETDARDIDVDLVTGGFLRGARAAGARLVVNARVESMARENGTWRVSTPAGEFEAPVVVNAAGAWASPVARLAGAADIFIEPRRRSAAIVPLPEGMDPSGWAMFLEVEETWYARPMGGALMVSSAEAIPVEPHDIVIDRYDEIMLGGIERYQAHVTAEVTQIRAPWAGLRSFSPDGEPVVGPDALAEGFFWLAGQGGYGFQTAPALSRLAADLILSRPPSLDAEVVCMLAPGRFQSLRS